MNRDKSPDNKNAEQTTKEIRELILIKHGTPETIASNNGLEFINITIKKLAEEYNFN